MKIKVLFTLMIAGMFAVLVAAGCAKKGNNGATGAQGAAGPLNPAPSIAGLDPTMSSYNTVISINGANFAATASNDTVYCDGAPAMLVSATSTQLTVTGCGQANPASPYQASVAVLVNDQMSNTVNEWIVPSGYVWQFPASSLTGPQGEVYDSTAGKLYVADDAGVFAVDNATGWTTQIVSAGCPSCTLSSPAGIAMDDSGDLVVTDSSNKTLVGIDPTTGTTWYILGPGNGLLNTPIGVTYSNGYLYVANSGSGNITQINDSTLDAVNLTLNVALAAAPYGITADASGNLYVACQANNTVAKVAVSGANGTVTNGYVTGITNPYGMSVSGTSLLVTRGNNSVLYTAPIGGGAASTMCADFSSWETHANSSIIPDGSGGIFVGDPSDGLVYHVDSACDTSTYAAGFANPFDMTYSQGDFYVINSWFNKPNYGDAILDVRSDGAVRVLAQINGEGASITPNPSGGLTAGSWDGSVINISSTGVTSTVFPLGTFNNGVSGFAYDNSGNLFINNCGTIAKWDGSTLNQTFATGTDCYQIALNNGYIYISDYSAGTIDFVNASTGGAVNVYIPSSAGIRNHGPEGIGFDIYGNFYVPNYADNSLIRVDPQKHVTVLVPAATSPMIHPNGIAIPPSQLIYTVEERGITSRMWVIAP